MATLQIRKETSKVWRHIPSNDDPYIVSKLYIKSEGDNIRVVELGGSQRGIYNFADVSVYDIGGVAETFTSASELMQRLEALGYIGFFYEGEVSPSTLISADLGNIIELGSDGKLYAIGGSQDLQSVTDLGSETTNNILLQNASVISTDGTTSSSLNSSNFSNSDGFFSTLLTFKTRTQNTDFFFEDEGGEKSIATREWANENKVDKVTTEGVERVYTINADGSQGTKATSELGGKRTMYLYFPIFQNVAASTSWYALPSTGQIFTGTGYTANASVTDANDFADLSYLTPRLFVPFQHKVKSVSIHGGTNTTTVNPVKFAVVTSYVSTANSGALTIPNPLIVAQEGILIYVAGSVNGFQKKFDDVNLDTSTLNAGTDYRILFKNANEISNLQRCMLIVEVEEVL